MSDAEYEVESVTKACVDAKRGKKVIWKYYVKWKGYGWDESTWEPERSFSGGSKHFIKTFWANALTRGRDHTNPLLFEKGEEVISGTSQRLESSSSGPNQQPTPESEDVSDDEPLTTKKRRMDPKSAGGSKPKRQRQSEPTHAPPMRAFGPRSRAKPKSKNRRRASSPVNATRRLSLTNMTDTDAVGDPDLEFVEEALNLMFEETKYSEVEDKLDLGFGEAKEVEDELMVMNTDDHEIRDIPGSSIDLAKIDEATVVFQDLQKYSIDPQNTIEVVTEDKTPADDSRSSPDPLFDSPSRLQNKERSLFSADPAIPLHRTRSAGSLVKFIGTPQTDQITTTAIPAKARLMSGQPSDSSQNASGSSRVSESRPKPGPRRSAAGLSGKNRSSLLTARKGGLTSVKGRFKPTNGTREEAEPIEDSPAPSHIAGHSLAITSWSDEDAAGETDHEHQEAAPTIELMETSSTHDPHSSVPSSHELLEVAGLKLDTDKLPDFEDETPQPPVGTLVDDPIEDAPSAIMTAEDKETEKSLAEVTEHLFPSAQATTSVQPISSSSWKTSKDNTIFGRMYKVQEPVQEFSNGNESVPTFKLILNADVSVPLTLKDLKNMKGVSLGGISADKSLDGQAGSFYSSEDAIRIVSTFSGLGSARVELSFSADENQGEHFAIFKRRLQSGEMFVAKAGKELLAFFSSQNLAIAQRLAAPQLLIGIANTVLLMRVQITNTNEYANAVMRM